MVNVLDKMVSLFENVRSTEKMQDINLYEYLTNPTLLNLVEDINRIRKETNKDLRNDFKKRLPAITPSGTFNNRNSAGIEKHSRLICLDIDQKDNLHIPNYSNLIEVIRNISNVAYCGRSVSGTGYFVLIPISNPFKHKHHFKALQDDFKRMGIIIDKSCSNVDRLRLCSFDSKAYINTNASVYTKDKEPQRIIQQLKRGTKDKGIQSNVEDCIKKIIASRVDITGDYPDWLKIGFALAAEFKEEGRDYFHMVSQFSEKYEYDDTDNQFTNCLNKNGEGVSIGTFFHYCKEMDITYR